MNTLTKNRILEKGDEYRSPRGEWLPVPAKDLGLQVMFTPYKEVRRPSEKPVGNITLEPKPISPDNGKQTTAKAESETKPPAPTHSGAGESLPTIVSKKAHKAEGHPDVEKDPTSAFSKDSVQLRWPDEEGDGLVWIGRNGTFNPKALNLHKVDSHIRVIPVGKRGVAKNAVIEFPVSIIPKVVDWLIRQQEKP